MSDLKIKKLTTRDIFPTLKLIKAFGVSEFKKVFTPENLARITATKKEDDKNDDKNDDKVVYTLGVDVVLEVVDIFITNLGRCENEIYNYMAHVTESTPEEIADLPMADFAQLVIDLVTGEGFGDFFTVVHKLLK